MFRIALIGFLVLAYAHSGTAATCTACKSTYDSEYTAAGTDPEKCTALEKYIQCLDTSLKADAGCPMSKTDSDLIPTRFTEASCTFTDTCVCQKDFWATDQSAGNAAVCSASRTYVLCMSGKTAATCNSAAGVTVPATVETIETRMKALGTDCSISVGCQCQINRAKSSVANDAAKCMTYKNELSCLGIADTKGCDTTTQRHTIAAATKTLLDGLTAGSCPTTAVCDCEIAAAVTDVTTSTKLCTAADALATCIGKVTDINQMGCNCYTQQNVLHFAGYVQKSSTCTSDGVQLASMFMVTLFGLAMYMLL